MADMYTQNFSCANDIGFSSVKIGFKFANKWEHEIIPSMFAQQYSDEADKQRVKTTDDNINNYMKHYLSHILVNVPDVNKASTYYVGKDADIKPSNVQTFSPTDIKTGEKSRLPLTKLLTYAIIGSKAFSNFYITNNKKFPNPNKAIKANVTLAVALPAKEALEPDTVSKYAHSFVDKDHKVNICNFAKDHENINYTVNIHVQHLLVGIEGQVGYEDIQNSSDKTILNSLCKQLDTKEYKGLYDYYYKQNPGYKNGKKALDNPDDPKNQHVHKFIVNPDGVLIADIGDGTTDTIAMKADNSLDMYNTTSLNCGCNSYLAPVASHINNKNGNTPLPVLQEDISKYVQLKDEHKTPSYQLAKRMGVYKKLINDNINATVEKIANHITSVLSNNHNFQKLIIFGGGSIPLRANTKFISELKSGIKKTHGGDENAIPILFVPKKQAQFLNARGLEYMIDSAY